MNKNRNRVSTKSALVISSVGFVIAGCSAANSTNSGDSQERLGASTQAVTEVTRDEILAMDSHIVNVSATGDLCPDGTWAKDAYRPKGLLFSRFWEGPVDDLSCTVEAEIDVPVGYQITAPFVHFRGQANMLKFERRYSFENVDVATIVLSSESLDTLDMVDHVPELWSPSCGERQRVRFVAEFRASLPTEKSYFELDTIDFDTLWRIGVDYRVCGSDRLLNVEPGSVDEYCGSDRNIPCANQLACQHSVGNNDGVCVDPNETVPPRDKGQPCGGWANIQCQTDLVCMHNNQEEFEQSLLGVCLPAVGEIGDFCGPEYMPNVPCKEGLFCAHPKGQLTTTKCASANGEADSPCGLEGMPECKEGLTCRSQHCSAPKN